MLLSKTSAIAVMSNLIMVFSTPSLPLGIIYIKADTKERFYKYECHCKLFVKKANYTHKECHSLTFMGDKYVAKHKRVLSKCKSGDPEASPSGVVVITKPVIKTFNISCTLDKCPTLCGNMVIGVDKEIKTGTMHCYNLRTSERLVGSEKCTIRGGYLVMGKRVLQRSSMGDFSSMTYRAVFNKCNASQTDAKTLLDPESISYMYIIESKYLEPDNKEDLLKNAENITLGSGIIDHTQDIDIEIEQGSLGQEVLETEKNKTIPQPEIKGKGSDTPLPTWLMTIITTLSVTAITLIIKICAGCITAKFTK